MIDTAIKHGGRTLRSLITAFGVTHWIVIHSNNGRSLGDYVKINGNLKCHCRSGCVYVISDKVSLQDMTTLQWSSLRFKSLLTLN